MGKYCILDENLRSLQECLQSGAYDTVTFYMLRIVIMV